MNDKALLSLLLSEKTADEIIDLRRQLKVRELSELLHTFLCPLDHEKDCDFYKEEICTAASQARKDWVDNTEKILRLTNNESLDDLECIMRSLPTMLALINVPSILRLLHRLAPVLLERSNVSQASLPGGTCSSQSDPSSSAESPPQ